MYKTIVLLTALMTLAGCGGSGSSSTENQPVKQPFVATSLELNINSELMIADGVSTIYLSSTVYDAQGTSKLNDDAVEFYLDDQRLSGNTFTTTESGEYNFYAKINNIETSTQSVYAREKKTFPVVEIPIIFHVGEYDGKDYSHIDEVYVQQLINHLNTGFSNEFNTRNLNAVDTGIRFRLAKYTPEGNLLTEKGINRFNSQPYDDGRTDYQYSFDTADNGEFGTFETYRLAQEIHWPQNQYKNVYLIPSEDRNWATSYQIKNNHQDSVEGVEHQADYFEENSVYTDILLLNPYENPSHIIVHEMGHALSLLHPESYDGCLTADYIKDTISIDFQNEEYICEMDSLGQRFLTNPKNIYLDNFMHGYTEWTRDIDDYDHFTYGQAERMRIVINHGQYISELIHSEK
jgi:hypothetical protein